MAERELIERLEKLERDNRRLKGFALAAVILTATLGAIYATRPVPQEITAHEFDVVDGTGEVRIRMSTTPVSASVEVMDPQGNRAASMEVDQPGASFVTAGKDGGEVAGLSSGPGSGASVGVAYSPAWNAAAFRSEEALRDALKSYRARLKSRPTVGMTVSPSGGASFEMSDQSGHASFAPTWLNFYDGAGRPVVSLVNAQGSGGLTFYGKQNQQFGKQSFPVQRVSLTDWGLDFSTEDGTDVIRLGGAPDGGGTNPVPRLWMGGGSPAVALSDSRGFSMDLGSAGTVDAKSGATQQTSAASIIMFGNDKDHRVIWQAP